MHIIRLRGPWQIQCDDEPSVQRVQVPDADGGAVQRACYRRRFNRPTGLGPKNRVLVRISEWTGILDDVQLNGRSLEVIAGKPLELEITPELQGHNEICVSLAADPGSNISPKLSGEVSLAIDDEDSAAQGTET